ncbi:5-formyltetrahydrofolate cyclo-ligase [Gemmobacter lutimaris]|uniref:5-formyltetrahydrofolate cyclo-ligase n=1 Tax=Gemmobacter lutimaris TaxID=2306023 RepID=A0A398BK84_9RHOB|nr:5-formyltetrahydrofolate cyclo-ligase [Gemmobacter lutimaris]RID90094.1 5-formyltetrahydrofolate cyclo-ligase [Gemmobacter lutimaris]
MTTDPLTGRPASSPCMAAEFEPADASDVPRWRKVERLRLRAERDALRVSARQTIGAALCRHLAALLSSRLSAGAVFSAYWPIKGEPDLRPLMQDLHREGIRIALPVVETRFAPLVFRQWTPDTAMVRGDWNIPVPPAENARLLPDVALAPLVGWDEAGYRLGYGGGYFDRTLAALHPSPLVIGVGLQSARLATIHPQPHDIPLDLIVTEAGVQVDHG